MRLLRSTHPQTTKGRVGGRNQGIRLASTVGLSTGKGSVVPLVCSIVVAELRTRDAWCLEGGRHCFPLRPVLIVYPSVGPPSIVRTSIGFAGSEQHCHYEKNMLLYVVFMLFYCLLVFFSSRSTCLLQRQMPDMREEPYFARLMTRNGMDSPPPNYKWILPSCAMVLFLEASDEVAMASVPKVSWRWWCWRCWW